MAIKSINKKNIVKTKTPSDIKDVEILEQELAEIIKTSIGLLVYEDTVVDIKDYIEDLLLDWEDGEIEEDED